MQSIPFTFTNQYQDTVVVTAFMQARLVFCRFVLCHFLDAGLLQLAASSLACRRLVACRHPRRWLF
jgi:hypothetical protein